MCFNVSLAKEEKEIRSRFTVDFDPGMLDVPVFHRSAFSNQLLPVLIAGQVSSKELVLMEWGLIPHWVKDSSQAKVIKTKTLNARCETLFEKPSFKKAAHNRRGILPVDGFFEYRQIHKTKIPYYIKFNDHRLFALGVLYTFWEHEGSVRKTFSIITTRANTLLAGIHNTKQRMPLILNPADEETWLDPALPREEIEKLLIPYPDRELTAYPVSKQIRGADSNVPGILQKVSYDLLEDEERSLF